MKTIIACAAVLGVSLVLGARPRKQYGGFRPGEGTGESGVEHRHIELPDPRSTSFGELRQGDTIAPPHRRESLDRYVELNEHFKALKRIMEAEFGPDELARAVEKHKAEKAEKRS